MLQAFLLLNFVHGLLFLTIDGKLAQINLDFELDDVPTEFAQRVVGSSLHLT